MKPRYYIQNYLFVGCLFLLILNDHYLKWNYANWLTGKLSDAAGIIILPLFISFLFPRFQVRSIIYSSILFIFWKSPFSQSFIVFYNNYTPIQVTRVIDYSDLLVLFLLPIPYYLIRNIKKLKGIWLINIHPYLISMATILACIATSPPQSYYYTRTSGNLTCYRCNITIKLTQDEIIAKLKARHFIFDSIKNIELRRQRGIFTSAGTNANAYKIKQLVIDKDTLRDIDMAMVSVNDNKTKIFFNGMKLSQDISDQKLESKLRKIYKKIIFEELKSKINE